MLIHACNQNKQIITRSAHEAHTKQTHKRSQKHRKKHNINSQTGKIHMKTKINVTLHAQHSTAELYPQINIRKHTQKHARTRKIISTLTCRLG